jgi:uncharacterized protein (DUF924 family)
MVGGDQSASDEVLSFWFGPGRAAQWFVSDPAFDRLVEAHLAHHLAAATARDYDGWRHSAGGCLALCILLDQVPRNLYRGSPRAYAHDEAARAVTRHAVAQGFDRDLPQEQRLFLYLPLEHSEALADQRDCVDLIGRLDANPNWRPAALRHRDIIARFGRFPHRNAALGRQTTAEETVFLTEPDSSS